MDKKGSKMIVSYVLVAKLFKERPLEAIKFIEDHRNLFNYTDHYWNVII